MKQTRGKRIRGVILTSKGWKKLQEAKTQAEFEKNNGDRFSLEELGDRKCMDLSLHTISKIFKRSQPVDKYSLEKAFAAFDLELSRSDYTRPGVSFDFTSTTSFGVA